MTEPAHPPESQPLPLPLPLLLPPATTAELLTRITAQLGTQLSGLRPRHHGVLPCSPPSSP